MGIAGVKERRGSVLRNLQIGSGNNDVAVWPGRNRAWVTGGDTALVDLATEEVLATLAAPAFGVVADPARRRVYTADSGSAVSQNLRALDADDGGVVKTLAVGGSFGGNARGVALDAAAGKIYVANRDDDTVSIVDASTFSVIGTVNVGDGPVAVTVAAGAGKVYVGNELDNTISVLDTSNGGALLTTIADTGTGIGADNQPLALAVDDSRGRLYVANFGNFQGDGNTVSAIDTANDVIVQIVTVGLGPRAIVVAP